MKKKLMALILALLLAVTGAAFAQETQMILASDAGLMVPVIENAEALMLEYSLNFDEQDRLFLSLDHYYEPELVPLYEQLTAMMTAEPVNEAAFMALYEEFLSHVHTVARITLVETADYEAAVAAGKTADEIHGQPGTVVMGMNEGFVYLLHVARDVSELETEGFAEEEIAAISDCIAAANALDLAQTAQFTTIVSSQQGSAATMPEKMPAFSTKNIYGETVTNEIFAGKDLTVINFWGTFCGPCINEMPELGEWAKEMPENVQIIGVLTDVYSESDEAGIAKAKEIAESTGASFPHLIGNDTFGGVMMYITAVPTTIFVDGEGNIVGEPVVGAYVKAYKDFVNEYLAGKE